MALDSTATAHWEGDLPSGSGATTLTSGAGGPFPVDWRARSEEHGGKTSPEELIASAHAACYSMSVGNILGKAGTPPNRIDTSATATFVPGQGITGMHLTVSGDVPGVSEEEFAAVAEEAKANCPVSKALAGNVPITLEIRSA